MEIKSFVLVEQGGRYLLIKEASFRWKGKWFLPGGNVKKGERPDLAVIRETREEAGIEISLDGIFYMKCYMGLFTSKLHIFYTGRILGGEIKTKPNKHSLAAGFFTYDEIKKMPLRQKLFKILERYRKSPLKMPVKHFKLILFESLIKRMMK